MAVTNGDIKALFNFATRKYLDLVNWFVKKNGERYIAKRDSITSKNLFKGMHIAKIGDTVYALMDWDSGRLKNEAWITISSRWQQEVEKEAKKRGIEARDLGNSYYNEFQVKNELGSELDKYKYMKNTLTETQNIIESNSPENAIRILTESYLAKDGRFKKGDKVTYSYFKDDEQKQKVTVRGEVIGFDSVYIIVKDKDGQSRVHKSLVK